jgi:hypothetical protein
VLVLVECLERLLLREVVPVECLVLVAEMLLEHLVEEDLVEDSLEDQVLDLLDLDHQGLDRQALAHQDLDHQDLDLEVHLVLLGVQVEQVDHLVEHSVPEDKAVAL